MAFVSSLAKRLVAPEMFLITAAVSLRVSQFGKSHKFIWASCNPGSYGLKVSKKPNFDVLVARLAFPN